MKATFPDSRTLLCWSGLLLTASLSPLSAAVFTSDTLIEETNLVYENQDIVVQGCAVTINGPHAFNSVQVIQGGVLRHSPAIASQTYALRLTIAGSLMVDAASRIDTTGCGYLGNLTLIWLTSCQAGSLIRLPFFHGFSFRPGVMD